VIIGHDWENKIKITSSKVMWALACLCAMSEQQGAFVYEIEQVLGVDKSQNKITNALNSLLASNLVCKCICQDKNSRRQKWKYWINQPEDFNSKTPLEFCTICNCF
jgi:predicted transcriptional regulator